MMNSFITIVNDENTQDAVVVTEPSVLPYSNSSSTAMQPLQDIESANQDVNILSQLNPGFCENCKVFQKRLSISRGWNRFFKQKLISIDKLLHIVNEFEKEKQKHLELQLSYDQRTREWVHQQEQLINLLNEVQPLREKLKNVQESLSKEREARIQHQYREESLSISNKQLQAKLSDMHAIANPLLVENLNKKLKISRAETKKARCDVSYLEHEVEELKSYLASKRHISDKLSKKLLWALRIARRWGDLLHENNIPGDDISGNWPPMMNMIEETSESLETSYSAFKSVLLKKYAGKKLHLSRIPRYETWLENYDMNDSYQEFDECEPQESNIEEHEDDDGTVLESLLTEQSHPRTKKQKEQSQSKTKKKVEPQDSPSTSKPQAKKSKALTKSKNSPSIDSNTALNTVADLPMTPDESVVLAKEPVVILNRVAPKTTLNISKNVKTKEEKILPKSSVSKSSSNKTKNSTVDISPCRRSARIRKKSCKYSADDSPKSSQSVIIQDSEPSTKLESVSDSSEQPAVKKRKLDNSAIQLPKIDDTLNQNYIEIATSSATSKKNISRKSENKMEPIVDESRKKSKSPMSKSKNRPTSSISKSIKSKLSKKRTRNLADSLFSSENSDSDDTETLETPQSIESSNDDNIESKSNSPEYCGEKDLVSSNSCIINDSRSMDSNIGSNSGKTSSSVEKAANKKPKAKKETADNESSHITNISKESSTPSYKNIPSIFNSDSEDEPVNVDINRKSTSVSEPFPPSNKDSITTISKGKKAKNKTDSVKESQNNVLDLSKQTIDPSNISVSKANSGFSKNTKLYGEVATTSSTSIKTKNKRRKRTISSDINEPESLANKLLEKEALAELEDRKKIDKIMEEMNFRPMTRFSPFSEDESSDSSSCFKRKKRTLIKRTPIPAKPSYSKANKNLVVESSTSAVLTLSEKSKFVKIPNELSSSSDEDSNFSPKRSRKTSFRISDDDEDDDGKNNNDSSKILPKTSDFTFNKDTSKSSQSMSLKTSQLFGSDLSISSMEIDSSNSCLNSSISENIPKVIISPSYEQSSTSFVTPSSPVTTSSPQKMPEKTQEMKFVSPHVKDKENISQQTVEQVHSPESSFNSHNETILEITEPPLQSYRDDNSNISRNIQPQTENSLIECKETEQNDSIETIQQTSYKNLKLDHCLFGSSNDSSSEDDCGLAIFEDTKDNPDKSNETSQSLPLLNQIFSDDESLGDYKINEQRTVVPKLDNKYNEINTSSSNQMYLSSQYKPTTLLGETYSDQNYLQRPSQSESPHQSDPIAITTDSKSSFLPSFYTERKFEDEVDDENLLLPDLLFEDQTAESSERDNVLEKPPQTTPSAHISTATPLTLERSYMFDGDSVQTVDEMTLNCSALVELIRDYVGTHHRQVEEWKSQLNGVVDYIKDSKQLHNEITSLLPITRSILVCILASSPYEKKEIMSAVPPTIFKLLRLARTVDKRLGLQRFTVENLVSTSAHHLILNDNVSANSLTSLTTWVVYSCTGQAETVSRPLDQEDILHRCRSFLVDSAFHHKGLVSDAILSAVSVSKRVFLRNVKYRDWTVLERAFYWIALHGCWNGPKMTTQTLRTTFCRKLGVESQKTLKVFSDALQRALQQLSDSSTKLDIVTGAKVGLLLLLKWVPTPMILTHFFLTFKTVYYENNLSDEQKVSLDSLKTTFESMVKKCKWTEDEENQFLSNLKVFPIIPVNKRKAKNKP